MVEPRVKTEILVAAGIRHCERIFVTAVLRRRGDADAGALFIKVSRLDGTAAVFSRAQSFDGGTEWRRSTGEDWISEEEVEKRLESEIRFDPDLWIVEVENPAGRNPFEDLTG
ncbi:MAG: DUF1491 family protein [Alphaproteobacteria bacterium]